MYRNLLFSLKLEAITGKKKIGDISKVHGKDENTREPPFATSQKVSSSVTFPSITEKNPPIEVAKGKVS